MESLYGTRTSARDTLAQRALALDLRTLSRIRVVIFALYIGTALTAYPAMAQFQEVGEQLCSSGFGQVIAVIFSLASIYYLFKFIFKVMDALDKHRSARGGEHEASYDQLESAGSTLLAAFVPVFAAIFFELIGLNTFSCLNLNIGILG